MKRNLRVVRDLASSSVFCPYTHRFSLCPSKAHQMTSEFTPYILSDLGIAALMLWRSPLTRSASESVPRPIPVHRHCSLLESELSVVLGGT